MEDEGCVYWLHLDSHWDYKTQGYIGVTSRDPKERLLEHYTAAYKSRRKSRGRFVLHQMIDKYGFRNINLTIIFVGDITSCYNLEQELRPKQLMGWNMACGGKNKRFR